MLTYYTFHLLRILLKQDTALLSNVCQDKSWEDRNEQANEDEEKKTGRRRDKILLIFRMCELNRQVEVRVGHSSGFRLRVFMNL